MLERDYVRFVSKLESEREFAETSAAIEAKRAARFANGESEPDEYASVWSGQISDDPFPGDPRGHLKFALMLAEVVGTLQSVGAPSEDIRRLNECFTAIRHCKPSEIATCGKQLGEQLENAASHYPEIVSRVADLQSRIGERVRLPAIDDGRQI